MSRDARVFAAALVAVALAVAAPSAYADGMDVAPSSAPDAYIGQQYSQSFYAVPSVSYGTFAPYTAVWASGTLPDGLSYQNAGDHVYISGTPTQALQSTQFTLSASDSAGHFGSRTYTLNVGVVDPGPALDQVNGVLATVNGVVGLVGRTSPTCVLAWVESSLNGAPPPGC